MQKLFWTTAATVILLNGTVLNAAAPTKKSMSINQLVANSDMIVSGKITEVKGLYDRHPVGGSEQLVAVAPHVIRPTFKVGLIEVKRMIYGSQDVKRVMIYLGRYDSSNQYKVGDSGTWFLVKLDDAIDRGKFATRLLSPESGQLSLIVFEQGQLLYHKKLFHGVFEAEHPSRFWPDDPQWHKREKGVVQKLSDEQKKKRRQQLHQEVAKRLRAKIKLTNKELKSLKKNLDSVVPVKDKNEP